MTKQLKNFINGEWVTAKSTVYEDVPNPATGEILAQVPLSNENDFQLAVDAADEAFKTWSKTPVPRRARLMFKFQQLLVKHWDELAEIITIENGKSFSEARGEVQRGIENVEFASGVPTLMMGDTLPDIATGVESSMFRYPLGLLGELHHLTSQ